MGYSKKCQEVQDFVESCSNDIATMLSICLWAPLLSVRAPGKTTDSLLSKSGYEKPIYLILSLQLHLQMMKPRSNCLHDETFCSKEHFFTRIGDLWNGWNGPFIWFLARLIHARVIAIAHSKDSRVTWQGWRIQIIVVNPTGIANPRQYCHCHIHVYTDI